MAWSRYYGRVRGKAGSEASRTGNEDSGLLVEACSKQGRIEVRMQTLHNGRDMYWISMHEHGGNGWVGEVVRGIVGEPPELPGILPPPDLSKPIERLRWLQSQVRDASYKKLIAAVIADLGG